MLLEHGSWARPCYAIGKELTLGSAGQAGEVAPDHLASTEGGHGAAFESPLVEGGIGGFTGGAFDVVGPFRVGIKNGEVGGAAHGDLAEGVAGEVVLEFQQGGRMGGEGGDDLVEGEVSGVVEFGEGQAEFGFESEDAEGGEVEFDVFLVIAMGGVIAAEDGEGAVAESFDDRGAVVGGT